MGKEMETLKSFYSTVVSYHLPPLRLSTDMRGKESDGKDALKQLKQDIDHLFDDEHEVKLVCNQGS